MFSLGHVVGSTQHITLRDESPVELPSNDAANVYLNKDAATISGPADARHLILSAMKSHYFAGDRKLQWVEADLDSANFFCIIHVVKWKDTPSDNASDPIQTVDLQHWYVYNGASKWAQDDFATNKRILGAKNLALLYIHLNTDGRLKPVYRVQYDIDITSKTPANVLHLFQAVGAFLPASQNAAAQPAHYTAYGFTDTNVSYVPSDVSVTGNISTSVGSVSPLGDSVVFDNEGKYWWDVSVAVPIRKMSQVQFNNTDNSVTSTKTDKRSVFAALDLYPFKKDVKKQGFDWRPYGLAGVSISQQPLHKLLFAVGWGPQFAQFYAGVLLSKQQSLGSLSVGSSASPVQQLANSSAKFAPQFAFGINMPVRGVFQAITGQTKSTQ
jgi:hypothetical protein